MKKLVKTGIEIDEKVTVDKKLPETMILYTVDTDHLIITAKPLKALEKKALTKTQIKVVSQHNRHIVILPSKIYNFYHFDENDYTIMASDKDSTIIIVAM